MITSEKKQAIIADLQKDKKSDKKDTGSATVQVGILTERIKELTEHLKVNKHDFAARRGLLQMVGQRRRYLKYIADKDSQAYLDLIKKLGLRR
jgi:small subunit ribosomal protein S15